MEDAQWMPSYSSLVEGFEERFATQVRIERSGGHETSPPWREPSPERQVFDFWRDLHWHFDTALTAPSRRLVREALKHYDVRIVCRAIAGGRRDEWIQDVRGDGKSKRDGLEWLIKIDAKGDRVDRFSALVTEDELDAAINAADDNRTNIEHWKAERFEMLDRDWMRLRRGDLRRRYGRKYPRYQRWLSERAVGEAA